MVITISPRLPSIHWYVFIMLPASFLLLFIVDVLYSKSSSVMNSLSPEDRNLSIIQRSSNDHSLSTGSTSCSVVTSVSPDLSEVQGPSNYDSVASSMAESISATMVTSNSPTGQGHLRSHILISNCICSRFCLICDDHVISVPTY